jgi:hypothetical protein
LNPKGLLGSDYGPGTMLELIPRPADSPDLVPERAKMLKGCDIYINGAPCPMCMSAIYWSRIDHLYFGASLEDTSHIGALRASTWIFQRLATSLIAAQPIASFPTYGARPFDQRLVGLAAAVKVFAVPLAVVRGSWRHHPVPLAT